MLVLLDLGQFVLVLKLVEVVFSCWGGLDLWVYFVVYVVLLVLVGYIDGKDFQKLIDLNVVVLCGMIGLFEFLLWVCQGMVLFFDDLCVGEKFFGSYGVSKVVQMVLLCSWQVECVQIGLWVWIVMFVLMFIVMCVWFFLGEDCGMLVFCWDEVEWILGELFQCVSLRMWLMFRWVFRCLVSWFSMVLIFVVQFSVDELFSWVSYVV